LLGDTQHNHLLHLNNLDFQQKQTLDSLPELVQTGPPTRNDIDMKDSTPAQGPYMEMEACIKTTLDSQLYTQAQIQTQSEIKTRIEQGLAFTISSITNQQLNTRK
jgi:alpha-D-ribose 1-methylphosphonate 5-triphosphate diphosphatase PhnM